MPTPSRVTTSSVGTSRTESPSTFVVTAITITTAVTTTYLLQSGQPWQFIKLVLSANTNVTIDSTIYL